MWGRPASLTLTLTRVALRPEYLRADGEPDGLTDSISLGCKTKLREISDQMGLLGDVCDRFVGRRRWKGLREGELRDISDALNDALTLSQPPRLLTESYGFGLTSYRVVVPVIVASDDPESILRAWRKAARRIREIIDDRMRGTIVRGSLASQYFTEIYSFYEMRRSLYDLCLNWSKEIESSLLPSRDWLRSLMSPLKLSTPPPEPELTFLPSPVYMSRDGIFAFFHYDPEGEGKRRNLHLKRRKMRRIFRLALDLSLGLKVFLENEDLWLAGSDDLWGAVVGMIYLNPKVISALMRGKGRKFLGFYSCLLKSMGLFGVFERYEGGFTFPFPTEDHIQVFAQAVRLLGGGVPKGMARLPLTGLQLAILKLLILKEDLDSIEEWDEGSLELLSITLCDYARRILDGGISGRWRFTEDTSIEADCSREFFRQISARKRKQGLTVREISVLLGGAAGMRVHTVNANLRKLEEMGIVVRREERRSRSRRRGKRTKIGLPVSVFSVDTTNHFIQSLMRLMEGTIMESRRRIAGASSPDAE
ncbi:MAG: hypothetical protein QXI51_05900 [Candidatus Korarchaeum sp.]